LSIAEFLNLHNTSIEWTCSEIRNETAAAGIGQRKKDRKKRSWKICVSTAIWFRTTSTHNSCVCHFHSRHNPQFAVSVLLPMNHFLTQSTTFGLVRYNIQSNVGKYGDKIDL